MCMGLSYVTHNKNGNYYLLETYFSLKWHEPRKYLWSLGTAFALGPHYTLAHTQQYQHGFKSQVSCNQNDKNNDISFIVSPS